jgi:radical SAM superfamily enzyme YgiQ (UPF0313 family)
MRILLYNPDNGVTRNFMPHLWMFLLKALTPPGHEVLLIDGNAQPMDELQIAQYIREQNIGLVGIGAMTRMIAKAYRIADAVRSTGTPVVMGGPHVTELPDEALGRDGGPRHADAVALGEADETWPQIVNDAARGELRFRTNESVVSELLLLKARARKEKGQIAVFFIDDNFAINVKRTKSLLRDIIAAKAQLHWVAQISANLLRDEELADLIAASGGKWVFIGMESIDPANLKDVNKGFNKPSEYAAVLERLARRNVYAITSFIFGMDNDTYGVAERTLAQVRNWPPGLPIFGLLTPLPATPLYKRLEASGRLTRPKHWREFVPFAMAHAPLKMTIEEVHAEVKYGWQQAYSPEALAQAVDALNDQPLGYRINIFLARLCFRGIYFPMMGKMAWLRVILQNRRTISKLIKEALFGGARPANSSVLDTYKEEVAKPEASGEMQA